MKLQFVELKVLYGSENGLKEELNERKLMYITDARQYALLRFGVFLSAFPGSQTTKMITKSFTSINHKNPYIMPKQKQGNYLTMEGAKQKTGTATLQGDKRYKIGDHPYLLLKVIKKEAI
jgi:hypothetical protein